MGTVKPIPDGYRTITPHLVVDGAAKAIEFYKKAFGAEEISRAPAPGGKIMHSALKIGDSMLMLVDDFPEWKGGKSTNPRALGGSGVTVHLYVLDVDAAVERAAKAGATVIMPPADMFWGDRFALLHDPFGHSWSIATHIADVTPAEAQAAMAKMFGGGGCGDAGCGCGDMKAPGQKAASGKA
jgi:PhnB protein